MLAKNETTRISVYNLITANDFVLLSLLNRKPGKGKWTLIGGGIQYGEDPIAAIKRETLEESGLQLSFKPELLTVLTELLSFQNDKGEEEGLHLLGVVYHTKLEKTLPCKAEGDGDSSDGSKWFRVNSLQNLPTTTFVSEALKCAKIL